jgi:integrase
MDGVPPQSATFVRKTDARRWAEETEAAIRDGRYFAASESRRHTLAELIDRYIERVLPRTARSKRDRTQQLKWWKQELGTYTLADVTPSRISDCRDRLIKEGPGGRPCGPATVNRYLAALSHALNVARKEWAWIEESPLRRVNKMREPRGRVRFLSDEERVRLLQACEESGHSYLLTVVVLALSTGMRRSEIMHLRWEDVDIFEERIVIQDTKNGERRAVPLTGRALNLVKVLGRVRRIDTDLIFPSARRRRGGGGEKPIDLRTPWEDALEKARIENFRFHDLRHSAASYLAMNGATPTEIAEVLGHKTLAMVKRYAHLSEAHTKQVVASMNEKIFGGNTAA